MRCATGEVVVFHDDDLARLGGGTAKDRVRAMSWSALQAADLGGGERMPLLSSVLEEVREGLINIELKAEAGWRARLRDDGLAGAVAGLIGVHGAHERVLVSSFDPLLLARFHSRAPGVDIGLLFASDQSLPLRRAWAARALSAAALHPEAALVSAPRMRDWQARGYAVNVWTVDHPAELRALAALGVSGIITNRPAAVRRVLDSCVTVS